MTEKVSALLELLNEKSYRSCRRCAEGMTFQKIRTAHDYTERFRYLIASERPILFENDRFGFQRTLAVTPPGISGNVTPNYGRILTTGLDACVDAIRSAMAKTEDESRLAYGREMLACIDAAFDIAERYRSYAEESGCLDLSAALSRIPHKGARSFYEALVFLKLSLYCLRYCSHTHVTLGRFDQYMYPFYLADLAKGISREELLEELEEFFISINFDIDLYVGIQTGDDGQSMVLGGFDLDGNDRYNELSELCMRASLELRIIDPKINLRVSKKTPQERFEFATLMTKAGLGYPQYCNDDVVIPGLIKLGYAPRDAADYSVAACWEHIIPNVGADIPNIRTMDFPHVVADVILQELQACGSFDELMERADAAIAAFCEGIIESRHDFWERESPFLSLFFDGCCESLLDMFHGGTKYFNFGCHGAGLSTAADSLAAVQKTVFCDRTLSKDRLLAALTADFEGYAEERNLLLSCPKMGSGDAGVQTIAKQLLASFARHLNGRPNHRGGVWRAGTGSAMEYIFKGALCPATADGRHAGAPYASSFSPSPEAKPEGLLSVLRDFTAFDMTDTVNGGPLTVEIHDSVLRNDIGIRKTAALVRQFVAMGGHQLQLNSVNRETLLDAQAHPEKYPHLIVRVWGWSGYFNELDTCYQDHVIHRVEYRG